MKKLLNLGLILITLTFFTSCEKNPDTDIEIVQNQLEDFIKEKKITKCTIIVMYGESTHTDYENVDFTIENGFVIINRIGGYKEEFQVRYNLIYLSKYIFDTDNKLALYFSNTHF
jgi:hypothetical protein